MAANPIDDAVRDAAFHLIEVVRSIPETDLLALDSDPHPPSSLSVLANDLERAIAAALREAPAEFVMVPAEPTEE